MVGNCREIIPTSTLGIPRWSHVSARQLPHGDALTVSIGVVSKPQAKNSRKITTTAWYTLGSPIPCRCKTKLIVKQRTHPGLGLETCGWAPERQL